MPAKKSKQAISPSEYGRRVEAGLDGRSGKAAFTSGARDAQSFGKDENGKNIKRGEGMREAWNSDTPVRTYTSSKTGKLSVDGKTAGGMTHSFTMKDEDGNVVKQSGRGKIATRRQRYYDVRVGLGLTGG